MTGAVRNEHIERIAVSAEAQRVTHYLRHVEGGVTMRQLAREAGVHPSTIHRQIRAVEAKRDDVLMDSALTTLASAGPGDRNTIGKDNMTAASAVQYATQELDDYQREAMRILTRLVEPGACLAYAKDMEKAVVVRESADGGSVRTAVTDRSVAQAMAIEDWLVCRSPGRVSRYHVTAAGRAALKRMQSIAGEVPGLSEAQTPFGDQHREWATKEVPVENSQRTRKVRFNSAESPISLLARRRDKSGQLYLTSGQVAAAERLREDFELSQMGPRITQNWEKFLTGGDRGALGAGAGGGGSEAARKRVAEALADLGPGLGDVALRVCCFVEGVETAEKRLGWSARSGKVVLRIALQRLEKFYQRNSNAAMIG